MGLIINFERINQLTVHPSDNPSSGTFCYSITRKLIKECIDIIQTKNSYSDDSYQTALDILKYNKIILDESDIRNDKLDNLLAKE